MEAAIRAIQPDAVVAMGTDARISGIRPEPYGVNWQRGTDALPDDPSKQTTVDGKVWGRIEKGWICLTGYATLEEVTQTVEEEVNATSMTVLAKVLNVRAGAGTDHKVVTSLDYGTQVNVLEQKTVGGIVWARIDQGWVSMSYLA